MKGLAVLSRLILTIVAAGFLMQPAKLYAAARAGQTAPGFKVVTMAGQQVSLDNYRGHVLVVDFFASWCHPCRDSIPHLNEMSRKYGKQGLQVLGISVDEDGERAVRRFSEEQHIVYPVALAAELTLTDFGIRSVPIMFVIDKKGKVAEVIRGFNSDIGRSTEQLIKKLLAEK
jgi:peroxiredoxin